MADYLHVYEIFEERLLPFIRQMVEFFSTGRIPRQADEPLAEDKNDLGTPSAGQSTPVASVLKRIDDKLQELSPRSKLSSTSSEAATAAAAASTASASAATAAAAATSQQDAESADCSNGASNDEVFGGALESLTGCQYYGENLGKIQVAVLYDSRQMVLTLKIIQASELAAKDFSGTSDPYVKIMLLPDKRNKLTTKVKRKNLNPRWNETFLFEGFPYTKLLNRTIYLQVLDYDRFSRDDPIGEVTLPLCELQLSTSGQTMWKSLEPCKGHHGILGELLVSLNYKPSHGVMTVGILKARNLKAKDINGQSDPYVKIWLMYEGKRVEKRKTVVKEKCLNPIFEESFPFLVNCDKIRQTSLFISVMDYDRMGRNELIGQVLLGSKSGPMEIKHWNEMFAKCKSDVKRWHMLKSFS